MGYAREKIFYLIPPCGYEQGGIFFDLNRYCPWYEMQHAFIELAKRLAHYQVRLQLACPKTAMDDADYILYCDLGHGGYTPWHKAAHEYEQELIADLKRYYKKKVLAVLLEPELVFPVNYSKRLHSYFDVIFTFNDELVNHRKYIKYYYPYVWPGNVISVPFEEKKLCTLIASNKDFGQSDPRALYKERLRIITYFEDCAQGAFDFYGFGWPFQSYKNYCGSLASKQDKIACLSHYKFCICYENMQCPGYITEKIFDCFAAGCVPVYWGACNITQYIPTTCFIDAWQFKTPEQLYTYLTCVTSAQYEQHLEHIQKFCMSEKAYLFSIEFFIETILKQLKLR